MPEYITKEEFNKTCEEIKAEIADVRDNHLNTIFDAIVWLEGLVDRKINKVYWGLGAGFGLLAVVLTMLQVFG